ncbi:hypothetical protein U1Q18_046237 [Sarracenia purpurea var. burkii]
MVVVGVRQWWSSGGTRRRLQRTEPMVVAGVRQWWSSVEMKQRKRGGVQQKDPREVLRRWTKEGEVNLEAKLPPPQNYTVLAFFY